MTTRAIPRRSHKRLKKVVLAYRHAKTFCHRKLHRIYKRLHPVGTGAFVVAGAIFEENFYLRICGMVILGIYLLGRWLGEPDGF